MKTRESINSLWSSLVGDLDFYHQISEVKGLVNSVSEFVLVDGSSADTQENTGLRSALAVALNLICSASHQALFIECAQRRAIMNSMNGDVPFELNALFLIDPAALSASDEDYSSNLLDSDFERFFLRELLGGERKVWRQLFCAQRPLNELGALPGNLGRVDFSFQSPFTYSRGGLLNRYGNNLSDHVSVRYSPVYVIEIDGARYHQWFLDDARDHLIAELGHRINRIHEHHVTKDWESVKQSISQDAYLQRVLEIQNQPETIWLDSELLKIISNLRLQVALLRSLSRRVELQNQTDGISVLVIERDLLVAQQAISQLNELLGHLSEIAGISLPEFHAVSFSERGFAPLGEVLVTRELDPACFDLILDHSILRREGIFRHDTHELLPNELRIRSAHYPWDKRPIETGDFIHYKPPAPRGEKEGVYARRELLVEHYRYFLRRFFCKYDFRPGQLEILSRALERRSVIGLLPTGGGKSLVYQLAAILQPGVCVVVDPIRALMKDQVDSLLNLGFDRVDFVNSARSSGASRAALESFSNGEVWIMFVSPERFLIPSFRQAVSKLKANGMGFSYGVVDEAHCVSEWGHDFRTAYLDLGRAMQSICGNKNSHLPLLGLTATASFDVLADIERELQIEQNDGQELVRFENTIRNEVLFRVVETGDRLEHVRAIISDEPRALLRLNANEKLLDGLKKAYEEFEEEPVRSAYTEDVAYIREHFSRIQLNDSDVSLESNNGFATIVFCPHKTGSLGVESFYSHLQGHFRAGFFHGGTNSPRTGEFDSAMWRNLSNFREGNLNLMVATKAFGMGIDKANIRQTIHVACPGSIESFVQESGRCGRDGKLARSTIVTSPGGQIERKVLENFYRSSFRGELKERVMVYELRNFIFFPRVTQLKRLMIEFKSSQPNYAGLNARLGAGRWNATVFFTTDSGEDLGRWDTLQTGHYLQGPAGFFVDWLFNQVTLRGEQLAAFLRQTVGSYRFIGLERSWIQLQEGQCEILPIPFRNSFARVGISEDANRLDPSQTHVDYLLSRRHTAALIEENPQLSTTIRCCFVQSFRHNKTPDEFILDLSRDVPKELSSQVVDELKRAYVISRDEKDTAKALHRLQIVGLVSEFEIDYQNEIYLVKIQKHLEEYYFERVYAYLRRYSSRKFAEAKIKDARSRFIQMQADEGVASLFSVLLQLVTEFAYSRIAEKRLRSIDDMINLTNEALEVTNELDQSDFIKERIFYYFNAKYSRAGNYAIQNGIEISASFQDDVDATEREESFADVIKRYARIVEFDETDAFQTNLKHLRGACFRFARSITGHPEFKVLLGCTKLIIQPNSATTRQDARQDFMDGFFEWWKIEGEDFNLKIAVGVVKDWLTQHLEPSIIQEEFEIIEMWIRSKMIMQGLSSVNDWLELLNQRLSGNEQQ